ncbi:MAG: FmdB family transcriptional regulator [Phycisphaerae bacterium]|nr:FmdB family transcriptional regulator [Phycisphaerae bacterium]
MPTYRYAIVNKDGSDGETFEIFQRISDSPLSTHPESGLPVRRVPVAPLFQATTEKSKLSNKNLDRLGFTKYERSDKGIFEKKAGQGPDVLRAD